MNIICVSRDEHNGSKHAEFHLEIVPSKLGRALVLVRRPPNGRPGDRSEELTALPKPAQIDGKRPVEPRILSSAAMLRAKPGGDSIETPAFTTSSLLPSSRTAGARSPEFWWEPSSGIVSMDDESSKQ
jgi:hypothetical protein